MIGNKKVVVIIPAFNEEESLPFVIKDIPTFVDEIIVTDNGSTDNTFEVAKRCGVTVLKESEKGYGAACLKAIDYIKDKSYDIVVFLDGDYSDYPEEMNLVVEPIINNNYDLVIGSRMIGKREKGSMLPQALFGNWLSALLIKLFWNYKFTDLGPFRTIKYSSLLKLNMQDRNFGWTVEMQIKAAKLKMKTTEVPVRYRKRIGKSKVTGTISGTVKASVKILYLIFASVVKD
ncbi:Glycosyltransferase [Ignavibacterium album JCM 16511]|uniref:Glycosyltransferase n=1 Tax=Ignavibacterium album (strain DSM 19864 / JCM 16511 / NBRC 101810 / Mat9-16) TaxID=945713 RepID=I0AL20_IGNAJ|nr:glycosyltransferase family 2 protein [Ignavibacterium album]AFH49677.1 Glycosyltransferase [Ignavibacterium album JCM 16511]